MGKNYVIFLVIMCLMALIICGSAAADQTVIPSYADSNLTVSNDDGARFNANENITGLNNTYNFFNSSSQSATQGQNALHLSSNNSTDAGGVVFTNSSSGIFYMSDTGGRGWNDNGILMIAINGTIPDNFYVIITASGYQWAPLYYELHPDPANMTYVIGTVNETFTKEDFLYGLQTWKPCPASNYPIYEGQNVYDLTNTFSIMFIDLWAGFVGPNTRSLYPDYAFIDNGMIKITYEFFNLPEGSLAAFGAYAYCQSSKQGEGVRWVNRVGGTGSSGYYVNGVASTPTADFTATPTQGTIPLTVEFTDQSTGTKPLTYTWEFGDGSTSTEQNPTHTYTTPGTYTVKLTVTNAVGSSEKTMTILTSNTDIVAPTPTANLPSGSYNTTITVNLTAKDDLDPNPKIYYTLNGTDPTTSSTLYTGPITVANEGTTTLKFIAVDVSGNISPVTALYYTIDQTAPNVTANPVGGTFNTAQNITLTAADNLDTNITIYYTKDGTNPTTSSTCYTTPITINGLGNVILKFAALDDAGNWSPVYTETYKMIDIAAPVASVDLPSGSYTTDHIVRLSAVDELDLNPKIYYTLNGTNPTINSTLYDWPISINLVGTTILKVIAFDAAGHVSDMITRIYILDKPGASGTWNSTTLDTDSMYNSIAVDKSGYPHIVYYQKAQSGSDYPDLKYAYLDQTGWHIETLETTQSGSGYYVSLAMDSSGYPHIAYSQSTPDKLKYAYKDETGWHFFELATNIDVSYVNLVLFQDKPQISYYENTEERIKYMYYNDTGWITETVTPLATNGHWNSLALNSIGNPRISFYELNISTLTGVLKYAKRTPTGIWQISTVDDSGDVGIWNSLAMDSLGNPCISYAVNGGGLNYAYWANAQWNIETVDSLRSLASKLVLDQSDIPRIVYQDYITGNLKYAYKEGLNWVSTNIDTLDGTGRWISLTLNPSGSPSVSYMSANSRLKYANLVPFAVSADPIGGTYKTNQIVNLTSTSETTIYYTTDGSDPRMSSTTVKYTTPLNLNNTTTLKFAAVDSASNWSYIRVETYAIIIPVTNTRTNMTYNTIQSAIDDVNTTDGDTLTVNAGNYTENIILNKRLILDALGLVYVNALNTNLAVFTITTSGSGSIIQGFNINGTDYCGIYLDSSINNTIRRNNIKGTLNTLWGICLVNSNNNTIANNMVTDCEEGINLYNSHRNILNNNTVIDNHWDNIALNLSLLNTFIGNTISNADSGIRLINGSNNNTITQNNLTGNVWASISLLSSNFNQIIDGNVLSQNQEGVYLYDSSNNTLLGNIVQNNTWDGIAIHNSSYNTIIGNAMIYGNYCGLYMVGTSNHNLINLNNFNSNIWAGIGLNTAAGNTIMQNNLTGAHVGISVTGSSQNNISQNNITSNDWDGIDILYGSNNNTTTLNNISGSYYGERILDSIDNTIYTNNFVDNVIQVYDNSTNNYDNGTVGNYYNDWSTAENRPVTGGYNIDHHPSLIPF